MNETILDSPLMYWPESASVVCYWSWLSQAYHENPAFKVIEHYESAREQPIFVRKSLVYPLRAIHCTVRRATHIGREIC